MEHLLLLKGARDFAPGQAPIAALSRRLVADAAAFTRDGVTGRLVQSHQRRRIIDELPSRLEFVNRGFDFQAAELAAARARFTDKARSGDPGARVELTRIKTRQRSLTVVRARRLAELRSEPERVRPGEVEFLVHVTGSPRPGPGGGRALRRGGGGGRHERRGLVGGAPGCRRKRTCRGPTWRAARACP